MSAENVLELVRARARIVENTGLLIISEMYGRARVDACRLPAGGMNAAKSTIPYAHCIALHLEHILLSPVATGFWSKQMHNSHLGRCEDVRPHGTAGMRVCLTYLSISGYIEGSHQIECRGEEYDVSICEEEGGGARDIALPEEVDFAIGGDEVLGYDEY